MKNLCVSMGICRKDAEPLTYFFTAEGAGYPGFLYRFSAAGAYFLQPGPAQGAKGRVPAYGFLAVGAGDSCRAVGAAWAFSIVPGSRQIVGADNKIDQQSYNIANKHQQGPQHSVHAASLRIPIYPDDNHDPEDKKRYREK